MPPLKFNKCQGFYATLRERVDEYFESRSASRHADAAMIAKTILLLVEFLQPVPAYFVRRL